MNTNIAAYWIAVGVLALGLNSEYHQGRFVALHQVADRAGSMLCQVSTRVEQTLADATGLTPRQVFFSDNLLGADRGEMARARAVMIREQARAQAEMVRAQVREQILAQREVLRAQAEMRRADIQQLRWRLLSEVNSEEISEKVGRNQMMVICPKTGARVVVSDWSNASDDLPTVEVSDEF